MDISIDIETLGTKPGSVVLSIGAVAFDRDTGDMGKEFYMPISLSDSMAAGLTIDAATLMWWLDQDIVARNAAFQGLHLLTFVLGELSLYVDAVKPEFIWAKPPSFDVVLIESAYTAVGRDIPWSFRQPRDCRTLFHLTGTEQPNYGTEHHALDDAKAQAFGIIHAFSVAKALQHAV